MPPRVTLRNIIAVTLALLVLGLALSPAGRNAASAFLRPLLGVVQHAKSALEAPFKDRFAADTRRKHVRELEAEISNLRLSLAAAEEARAQNLELRRILDLPEPVAWQRVVAPLLARDPSQWYQGFRLAKGRRHGVALGSVALRGTRVIGRVTGLSDTTCTVATLANPACQLSVRVRGTEAIGILGGTHGQQDGTPRCLLTYLPRDAAYRPGLVVQTSGLGGTVPAGLTVGRVVPWNEETLAHMVGNSYVQLAVAPLADFSPMRFITLLCPPATTPSSN